MGSQNETKFRWNKRLIFSKRRRKRKASNKILNKFICVSDFGNQRFKTKGKLISNESSFLI